MYIGNIYKQGAKAPHKAAVGKGCPRWGWVHTLATPPSKPLCSPRNIDDFEHFLPKALHYVESRERVVVGRRTKC